MFDKEMLFILNQGWRLGFVILCTISIRAVLKRVTERRASYLLWCIIPICYFYIAGVECFQVFYHKIDVRLSNEPYFFLGEKECMVFKIIWGIIFVGMLSYMLYSYVKTKCLTKKSIHFRENIYLSEKIDIPFTIGIMKPKIYLPVNMQEEFYNPVICHEKVHIFRKDYLIKNLAFVFLTINWFQPLMWVAYYLFVKDMEVTCDEMVLREKSAGFRKQYAKALVELSVRETRVRIIAIGYGSVALKERVINISRNQKERFSKRILITVICIVIVWLGVSAYEYIRKPFGYMLNVVEATNDVWQVRTRIGP